jgi:Leucine rich repeat
VADRTNTRPRPWWSFLRFSLRSLIVMVLIGGVGMGWVVHEAHVQRDAVRAIQKAGGAVWYDWQWEDGVPNPKGTLVWPKWLVDSLGVDYFGHVVGVGMHERPSDELLVHVGRLRRLESLDLDASIRRLPPHRPPSPGEPAVTDAGLVHLKGLSRLERLDLSGTDITDAGLIHLQGLTRLERLNLSETAITCAGLSSLRSMNRLERLDLSRTKLDDTGMSHLKSLTNLSHLSLNNDTQITSVGLRHLADLKQLRSLLLYTVDLSPEILKELRQVLPWAKMTW